MEGRKASITKEQGEEGRGKLCARCHAELFTPSISLSWVACLPPPGKPGTEAGRSKLPKVTLHANGHLYQTDLVFESRLLYLLNPGKILLSP